MPDSGRTQRRLSVLSEAAPQRIDLGHGNLADDRRDRLGEHGVDRPARLFDYGEVHAVAILKLVLSEPGLAQETFERLRRRADARALGLLVHRLGALRQVPRDQRQPPRGRPHGDLAHRDARGLHLGAEQLLEIRPRPGLHPRGDFLGAQLEQEVAHADHPGYSAAQRSASLAM